MPGQGRRKAETKLTGVLVAVGVCAVLLAILFIGGRLLWLSFRGLETSPPPQAAGTAPQPSASAEPSAPGSTAPAVSAPPQPSATPPGPPSLAKQPAASTSTVSVPLAWDAVPDPNVTGYKILYGTEPGIHPESLSVGNHTSATLAGLQRATRYYIVVVSVDAQGNQSRSSNEVEVLTAQ